MNINFDNFDEIYIIKNEDDTYRLELVTYNEDSATISVVIPRATIKLEVEVLTGINGNMSEFAITDKE